MPRIGVLAGAFNPVTRAHLALLDAARRSTDELLCVVPRAYPHKSFEGASFEERLEMLRAAASSLGSGCCVETTDSGLFIDIARELRRGRAGAEIHFICGADAAERIITWDYGHGGAIERQLEEYGLLVAARQGVYSPPEHLRHRVQPIALDPAWQEISSTEVRRRIASREPWEHLVPEPAIEMIRRIYPPRPSSSTKVIPPYHPSHW